MIAKVIAHGSTRSEARKRLIAALNDFHVLGVKTNIGYSIDVLESEGFMTGEIDTGYLGREFSDWTQGEIPQELASIATQASSNQRVATKEKSYSAWDFGDNWRNAR